MEAYRFETTVQENGVIQIPEIPRFANREVEILIIVKPKAEFHPESLQTVEQFLDKWSGLLKGSDLDELKGQYLREKYG